MTELLERLRGVDPASLCDAGPGLRVLPAELRPLAAGARVVGRAVTVDAAGDLMPVLGGLHAAGPGDVLVVATGGSPWAVAGELFATEAQRRGLAGIVIDGYCRDRSTVVGLGLAVYARGSTPRAAPARSVPRMGVAVRIGDVVVEPGDLVIGDDDGLVVGTVAELSAAIAGAEAVVARERGLLAELAAGRSLFERVDFVEHAARLAAGEPSTLSFEG